MPPKVLASATDCITLKAFLEKDQKECIAQLKDVSKINQIAGSVFMYPRSQVEVENDEVS